MAATQQPGPGERTPLPGARELALAALCCTAVALVFTWPLPAHFSEHIPAGGEAETLALFNLTVVEHPGRWLARETGWWDLGIFAPHANTFAWSEMQPLAGLLHAALQAVGLGSVAAYNLLVLLWLVGGGLAAWLGARLMTEDRSAAFIAAAWLTAGAFVSQRVGALHLVALGPPLLSVWALLALSFGYRRRLVWLAAAGVVLTWATCAQYVVLLALFLVPIGLVALPWRRLGRNQALEMLAAAAVCVALVLPTALAWRERLAQMGMSRQPETALGVPHLEALVRPPVGHWLWPPVVAAGHDPGPWSMDVGGVFAGGRVLALLVARLRPTRLFAGRGRLALALALLFALALGVSLAPGRSLGGVPLWPTLSAALPGLDQLRVPSRSLFFASFALAVLGAAALAWLGSRWPRIRRPMLVVTALLVAAEMWCLPVATADVKAGVADHDEVLDWLATQPQQRPLLDLPATAWPTTIGLLPEARAMRRARRHGHGVVNGYSGHFPEPFWQVVEAMKSDPGGRGRRYLRALDVGHVLVHEHALSGGALKAIQAAFSDCESRRFGSDVVYRLPQAPPPSGLQPVLKLRGPGAPETGQLLTIDLYAPAPAALYVGVGDMTAIQASWPDEEGQVHDHRVLIRGSVLLDRGQRTLHARVLPQFHSDGPLEAVLVARETLSSGEPL